MIRYIKIDLNPKEFGMINLKLCHEIDSLKSIEKNPKFSDEVFQIFKKILP